MLWKVGISDIPLVLAASFLCAYLAIWFELLLGYIDIQYSSLYEKIYQNSADDTATANTTDGDTNGSLS